MADGVERGRERDSDERQFGTWQVVLAGWAIVLVFLILLAGVHAVASLRGAATPNGHLAGAVIPRHDTACGGPGIPAAHTVDGCEAAPLEQDRSAYW